MSIFNLYNDVQLYSGYAHSIADMNNDYKPDLILTTKSSNNEILFNILANNPDNNQYENISLYTVPNPSYIYGQSLFADFDSDGSFEHLLPACKDEKCTKSVIFIRKNAKVK